MSLKPHVAPMLAAEGRVALVTVAAIEGSTPREQGAQMLVGQRGFHGTIGGGNLEWKALAQAQNMLARGEVARETRVSLGPDTGQCCGGRVTLSTRVFQQHEEDALLAALTAEPARRTVLLFGAGHVGRAVVLALAASPFAVTWVDPRAEAFPPAVPGNVQLFGGDALQALAKAPAGSLPLIMSHSHALDFEIVDAALRMEQLPHVLLIGSATKRARFLSRLRAAGHGEAALTRLTCPIGLGDIRSKTPYAIAISTAAQLLALDEALASTQHSFAPATDAPQARIAAP